MKNINKIVLLFVVMLTSLSLTSCDDDYNFFGPPFIGNWTLVENQGYPVPENQSTHYVFYDNGEGYYSYYDMYGRRIDEWFRWDDQYYNMIYMYFNNPYMGTRYTYYSYDGNYLYFSAYSNFATYEVYAPSRW